MKFTRFKYVPLVVLSLSVLLFSACSSSDPAPTSTDQAPGLIICDQLSEEGLFDLQAASIMQILIGDDNLDDLGLNGARDLAGDLYSPEDTFCGLGIQEDLLADLEEIEELYQAGEDGKADELFDDVLKGIENDQYSGLRSGKVSAPRAQAGGAQTRRIVKNYLDLAGLAYYWGNDDKAEAAFQAANDTYEKWADKAVDSASIREALRIAAEAQLLGLDNLGDKALERAMDLAELDLMGEIDSYEPCKATIEDTGRLLDTTAQAALLGVDIQSYHVTDLAYEWLDIQERREKGEEVPECDLWQVTLLLDTTWEEGYHIINWEGEFKVLEDESLEGQGKGTLISHVEIPCVNVLTGETTPSTTDVEGSFEFQVEGKWEDDGETGVFKFLFPAQVAFSGVDTCNEFDEATFLPAYVIEEITVYGGSENYDLETDKIYMVLPATDGASQVYETLIGPLELSIRYLGTPGDGS